MRQSILVTLCLGSALALSACQKPNNGSEDVERALADLNVVDESNLNDIMLTIGDPNEAVTYFNRAVKSQPDRIDLQRGLAKSLVRAKQPTQAVTVWKKVVALPGATAEDRVGLADAMIRAGDWGQAEIELNKVPPPTRLINATVWKRWWQTAKKNGKKPTVSMKPPLGFRPNRPAC